ALLCAAAAFAVRGFTLDQTAASTAAVAAPPAPEEPAPEIAPLLPLFPGRILETMRYRVAPGDRAVFLDAMQDVQHVRGRAGALDWRLYEDVAHPDGWLEAWAMQSWTDHLREANRLSDTDHQLLARVSAFHDTEAPKPCRFIAVDPDQRSSIARHATQAASAR
ncbi:MAG: MFS transporter, partial [Gemmatimonadaceae bacterium]|nr:MFS transporter [Acetobacteraceae bacterium]